MKTKEELSQDVGLVRDIEAWCRTTCANDRERNFRDALFRKAYATLREMQIPHVRRINEALCDMEFPSPTALGLRERIVDYLAVHHDLKKYRNISMPQVAPAKQG